MRWPSGPLKSITDRITKGTTPTTFGKAFTAEGINYIKAEALNGDSNLDLGGVYFIDDDTHNILKRSILF